MNVLTTVEFPLAVQAICIGTPLKYLKTLDRNCDLNNEKRTGAEMRPASVSGMVTGDAPIVPIFASP